MKKTANANLIPTLPLNDFSSDAVQPNAAGPRHACPIPDYSRPEHESAATPKAVLCGCQTVPEDPLVSLARHLHKTRMAGNAIFGKRVISDPQYDMLLELFIAHHEGRAVLTADLCRAGGVPATTALRHIGNSKPVVFFAGSWTPGISAGRRSPRRTKPFDAQPN